MKYLTLFIAIFIPLHFANAQSITIGTISKTKLCVGETIVVHYSATGTFAADNLFKVQLSDPNGSFTTFLNFGQAISLQDTIQVHMNGVGNNFIIRVISTDPYVVSSNTSSNIEVLSYPSPKPVPNLPATFAFGYYAFIGDSIQFGDATPESSGSTSLWKLHQDNNIVKYFNSAPLVTYPTVGTKTGSLSVTNSAGCATTDSFSLSIITCTPLIPSSAHIVTGTEIGDFPYVWVKSGGNYTTSGDGVTTVFVEAGASLRAEFRTHGIYYIKPGASFISSNGQGWADVFLTRGIIIDWDHYNDLDTIYCDYLQFDYSQVGGFASAQYLKIDSFSVRKICVGEPFNLYFSKTGQFDSLNLFFLQVSDTNGTHFKTIGKATSSSNFIHTSFETNPGTKYFLRIVSSMPSVYSDSIQGIQVVSLPDPKPVSNIRVTNLGSWGLVGRHILFEDTAAEMNGSAFVWTFDGDASILTSTNQTPSVSYSSEGTKSGKLTVTNTLGCSSTRAFNIRILGCDPVIPFFTKDSLFHICTGTESGSQANVWVKSGGNYTSKGQQTIFVEPGGIVQAASSSSSLYYLKKDAIFMDKNSSSAVILLNTGETITYTNGGIDTFYCDDLQFDYSKVGGSNEVAPVENTFHISYIHNGLEVQRDGSDISTSVFDILGNDVLLKTGRDYVNIDLSAFPEGIYLAMITCDNHKETRKIVVIH